MFFPVLMICAGLYGFLPSLDATKSSSSIAKCDPEIMEKINKFQCPNGRPGNLIKTATFNDIENVCCTTRGYYSENVSCVNSKFYPDENYTSATVSINLIYNDSSSTQMNITTGEDCGATLSSTNVLRVHIWYYEKVTAVYICSLNTSASYGPPAFFVKAAKGINCSSEDVEKGLDIIKSLGPYDLPVKLSEDCT